jgi:hypothetical protein
MDPARLAQAGSDDADRDARTCVRFSPVSDPRSREHGPHNPQQGGIEMADVHDFSRSVIDLAERLEDMADAASGKGNRRSHTGTRWLLLPAAGAGLYALATKNGVRRRATDALSQAGRRAAELPEDLLKRVRQTPQRQTRSNGGTTRRRSTKARATSGSSSSR